MKKINILNSLQPNMWTFFLMLFLFSASTMYYSLVVGFIEFIIALALIFIHFFTSKTREKKMLEYFKNVEISNDSSVKEAVLNSPLSLAISNLKGNVIWHNESFLSVIGDTPISQINIADVIPEFPFEQSSLNELVNCFAGKIDDHYYNVYVNIISSKQGQGLHDEKYFILYFIDVTSETNLLKTYEDEKSVRGIIVIDNYEDVTKNISDADSALIFAQIDRLINSWITDANGVIVKFEKDKYSATFENRFLKECIENKFEIMKEIKKVVVDNSMPITLSIGIGSSGENLSVNESFARSALDMALGRGGDQAVIKDLNGFSYFGGMSKEIEKRTKVRSRIIAQALKELILSSSNVIVMGHKSPDMDFLGAALGIFRAVTSVGVDINIVLTEVTDTIGSLIKDLKKDEDYEDVFVTNPQAMSMIDDKTLVIVLDTHKPSLVTTPDLLKADNRIVVIDHHRKSADFIENAILYYHEPYASSTCELVVEILGYFSETIHLKPLETAALYAGMVVDTQDFTYKTGVRTFEAASFLRRIGLDTIIAKGFTKTKLDQYLLKSEIIKGCKIYKGKIAIATYDKEDIKEISTVAQASDDLINIQNIEASFVLCKMGSDVYISARSLGKINVQLILEELGGGGHQMMAGVTLQEIEAKKAYRLLITAIDKHALNA